MFIQSCNRLDLRSVNLVEKESHEKKHFHEKEKAKIMEFMQILTNFNKL